MTRIYASTPAIALVSLIFSSACIGPYDLADGYSADATVTYSDGVTQIPGFSASSYEMIFHLRDGMNLGRTYTTGFTPAPASGFGVLTDAAGAFNLWVPDTALYTVRERLECYDTCVSWSDECYYDSWGDYRCNSYCSWYVSDCYWREYFYGVDVDAIASVSSFLNYLSGNTPVRSMSTAISESPDLASNTWYRVEKFVTPFSAPSQTQSQALSSGPSSNAHHLIGAEFQARRTECEDQSELGDDQMEKVRALRGFLGVASEDIACRQ